MIIVAPARQHYIALTVYLLSASSHPPFPGPAFIVKAFITLYLYLRLRLDANMRSACFIPHMCTCIPQVLGFPETNILSLPTLSCCVISERVGRGILYCIQLTFAELCMTSDKIWGQRAG